MSADLVELVFAGFAMELLSVRRGGSTAISVLEKSRINAVAAAATIGNNIKSLAKLMRGL